MIDSGSKGFVGATPDIPNPYSGGGAQNNARSLGAIGRALQQAGATGMAIADDLQRAENARTENETINYWESEFGRHEAETMRIKDPQERVAKMESLLGSLESRGYEGKKLSPVVRDRLRAQWGRLATKYRNRALSQSAQLMIEQAKTSIGTRLDQAETLDDVNRILGDNSDYLSAAEKEAILHRKGKEFRDQDLDMLLMDDDFEGAEKHLNRGGFTDYEKKREMLKVETAKARKAAGELNFLMESASSGQFSSKEEFARSLESIPNLEPGTAKKALRNWDNSKPVTFEEKSSISDKMNKLYSDFQAGKISRSDYEKSHHNISAEVHALGSRYGTGGLRSRLHQLDPAGWRPDNLKAGKVTEKEMMIEEKARVFDSAGGFGKPRKGEDKLTPSEALKAHSVRNQVEEIMKDWLQTKEGQEADEEAIDQKLKSTAAAVMSGKVAKQMQENNYRREFDSIMRGVLPKKK